ncbi:hypothetical protein LNP27_09565 [Flavobacterium galactosidilyticum]|uniref:hypothetical protein n=1 Tax=Flavobacterium galactosidilyticum TaxID=2893886 RepID=UPI001E5722CE|nr:hypothetical protein [Flavobacterium sp. F-340]UFH45381.1 hypothetical protein LNP27_09565 [Flavobacterium sp. F-340]
MRVEIFINGYKYLRPSKNFSQSFLKIIDLASLMKEYFDLYKTKADEIKILKEVCLNDDLVFIIHKHLTLEIDFAMNLCPYDIVYCSCLQPLTERGEVIKELMIDNYQLILTNRNWLETNFLKLYFELVDYGEADERLINALRRKT